MRFLPFPSTTWLNPGGLPGGRGWAGARFSQFKWGVWPLSLGWVGVWSRGPFRGLRAMKDIPYKIFCYIQMRLCTQLQSNRDRNEVRRCLLYDFNLQHNYFDNLFFFFFCNTVVSSKMEMSLALAFPCPPPKHTHPGWIWLLSNNLSHSPVQALPAPCPVPLPLTPSRFSAGAINYP